MTVGDSNEALTGTTPSLPLIGNATEKVEDHRNLIGKGTPLANILDLLNTLRVAINFPPDIYLNVS
jgi:hypothetical protein